MRITQIKYSGEFGDINVTIPRKAEQPLPDVGDRLTFGSARRWLVTKIEQREDILWVWLGTP